MFNIKLHVGIHSESNEKVLNNIPVCKLYFINISILIFKCH